MRRYRLKNGSLVCEMCRYHYHWTSEQFLRWIKRLKDSVNQWRIKANERTLRVPIDHKYRFNSPFSAIPPKDILDNAVYALDIEGIYHGFQRVLSDYYKIDTPPFIEDPDQVPEGAIACYYPNRNKVYSRGTLKRRSAFHEIYHALENFGIVPKTKDSEKHANQYAYGCLRRLE